MPHLSNLNWTNSFMTMLFLMIFFLFLSKKNILTKNV